LTTNISGIDEDSDQI